jgi:hypothetical protein
VEGNNFIAWHVLKQSNNFSSIISSETKEDVRMGI